MLEWWVWPSALAVLEARGEGKRAIQVQVLPAAAPVQVARAMKRPGIGIVEGEPPPPPDAAAISFPKDALRKKKLEAAGDFIKEGAWADATHVLQSLLNQPEDVFVEVERISEDGKTPTTFYTSIRNEGNRLLGTMPPAGLEVYELQFGAKAKDRLDEACEERGPARLRRRRPARPAHQGRRGSDRTAGQLLPRPRAARHGGATASSAC